MHSPEHRSQGRPFLAAPRPAFYFPARVVDSPREELERGIRRDEGAGLVVGQAGTGKSLPKMTRSIAKGLANTL